METKQCNTFSLLGNSHTLWCCRCTCEALGPVRYCTITRIAVDGSNPEVYASGVLFASMGSLHAVGAAIRPAFRALLRQPVRHLHSQPVRHLHSQHVDCSCSMSGSCFLRNNMLRLKSCTMLGGTQTKQSTVSRLLRAAAGIRNTVGITFHPDTGDMWYTSNGSDHLGGLLFRA